VDRVKALGVIIDSQLTFTYHIDQTVARAFTRANLLHKCFVSRDTASLTRAVIVHVRPLLVWSPPHVGKTIQIESLQRRFTKHLPGLKDELYKDTLEWLGLETLEIRRLRQDLVFTYSYIWPR